MAKKSDSKQPNPNEVIAELRRKLDEAEQTLSAIRNGEVDALVVTGETGDQIYTLKSAERPYRVMIEQMSEGALTLSSEGIILYSNESFARMVKHPLEEIVSASIFSFLEPAGRKQFQRLIKHGGKEEIFLLAKDQSLVPTYIALNTIREDEIISHSLVITDLTESLHTEQIIASEKFTRTLLEQAADAILVCNTNGTVIRASEKAFGLLGEDLVGQSLDNIFSRLHLVPGNGESRETKPEQVKFASIRDATIPSRSEVIFAVNAKSNRNLLLNFSRITEVNSILGYSISLSDITELKQAEDVVQKYTKELEYTNKELEAFSYSVSHDLRAPLRTLEGFSQIITEDYKDKLDETGLENLNRIRKASQYMSELIDDMLKLSRITRADMYQDKVNLSNLVQTIADELKASQPERKVEWIITPNLVTQGDKQLLIIALRNLLENAWKFTGKCQQARIEFGQVQQKGKNVYFIRDNGAGFNMQYADKLFQPFQRLHSSKDYEGTGIGLAIVYRVIRRHDGNIWAQSEKDHGTTFYFTLGD